MKTQVRFTRPMTAYTPPASSSEYTETDKKWAQLSRMSERLRARHAEEAMRYAQDRHSSRA